MKLMAESFLAIEKGFADGDVVAVAEQAKLLCETSSGIAALKLEGGKKDFAERQEYQLGLAALAAQLAALKEPGQLPSAALVLHDIRHTCVSCHLRFRDGNEESGLFPAHDNTIQGAVRLRDMSGAERKDRSGVVVFLDQVVRPGGWPSDARIPKIVQADMDFQPRVLPVVRGTTVGFPNEDNVFHNVFSLSKPKPFDLGIYEVGETRTVTFEETGLVRVFCNIHPKMASFVLVLQNPHFAVTDAEGRFVLTGLPDGEYTLRSWHELGGGTTQKVVLRDADLHSADIDIQETRKSVAHKTKFGKPYRTKY